MRIVMVSEHADPTAALGGEDAGGQNVHVAALACGLAGLGHEVTVYTRLTGQREPATVELAGGVTVRRLKAGPLAPLPKDDLLPHMGELGDGLAAEWRHRPPDVVHAHFWMSGLAALRGRFGLRVPLAQTFHALGAVKARHQGAKDTSPAGRADAERHVGLACDQVLATCRDEVRELRGMGIPAEQISVVPCGVDTDVFRPDGPVARRRGGARLLVLGRLVERKGVATVIAALPRLPGVELVVAGGPARAALRTDAEYRRLRALAGTLEVADRVTFTGSVPRDRVPALVRSADVVVCAPWYEPFGIVPLEAMACGVPVVASAVGGLADTVVHGSTGLLVPPRDPAALAGAAGYLLARPDLRAAFGVAGRRRAKRWYGWARVAAQAETVYLRMAGGGRRHAAVAGDETLAVGAP